MFLKATDGTNSAFAFFNWTVLKSFAVVNPGTQLFPESLPVNLQMQAVNGNGPITYSASNLPLWLSIDPHTGLISGILADYASGYVRELREFQRDGFCQRHPSDGLDGLYVWH